MKFKQSKIRDLKIINSEAFIDNRGYLKRGYCEKEFKKNKTPFAIKQINISHNKKAKTLRGFHFQTKPSLEKKIISCLSGSIHNIVIDLRKNSSTYLQWQSFKISSKNKLSILIPSMCANAFFSLENNTTILYLHSAFYHPKYSKSFHYNVKNLNLDWPSKPEVISKKDRLAISLDKLIQ